MPFLFIFIFSFAQFGFAQSIEPVRFQSSADEKRYQSLVNEIRCPVCQGQSIGGSNAELAKDLRGKVKEMIENNKNDDEIRDFMVARYGDFVVFKPPVNEATYLLWFAPFIFLFLALYFLAQILKKSKNPNKTTHDTTQAKELLK